MPVLVITGSQADHLALDEILNGSESDWELVRVESVPIALNLMREESFPIVICDRELDVDSWRNVIQGAPKETAVIVASRFADDSLWAEALNLGAYDVLAKPFDKQEAYRVVDSAWRHWIASRTETHQARTGRAAGGMVAAAIWAFVGLCGA